MANYSTASPDDPERAGLLIIGYGNTLRQDDGAGAAVAERLGGLVTHQLTPELAEVVSRAWRVVFVDASREGEAGAIRRTAVTPAASGPLGHHVTPGQLLAIAKELYGRAPEATLICIAGAQFGYGEELSPLVRDAVDRVVRTLHTRVRITLHGAVQGVGFRPFVHRLARELKLAGFARNSNIGLLIDIEGPPARIREFQHRLESERPPAAVVSSSTVEWLDPKGRNRFRIATSDRTEDRTTALLPDLATCDRCLAEITDAQDRRHGYAFTNCTHCGPRYSIITDMPYDRPATTMREFAMCPACEKEYRDIEDRRYHAQPVACPVCGPQLDGSVEDAAAALRDAQIVAVKGIGGFQLLADARNADAVARLRERKHREAKPFAIMLPSMEAVRQYCDVSVEDERWLRSASAPIVLMPRRGGTDIAPNVAPVSPWLGVMLPYSPLHHLLMRAFPFPVVATSGNASEEPIAIGNGEARDRLGGIADLFLMHNRPIARACDDSVVRRGAILRRARGYAPLPVIVARDLAPILAVGGHLKNTVAIAIRNQVILSQHIGDLTTLEARGAFERTVDDLCRMYRFRPEAVVCDLHPDYASTVWAEASGLPVIRIQHHHAHVAACAAENGVTRPYLGVAWDGTGYGLDGGIWGGEFFLVDGGRFERIAHLRPFRLPGGDAAARRCNRSAAALVNPVQVGALTTSVGRLFDAVAYMSGVAAENRFEGEAAMALEAVITESDDAYPLPRGDWREMITLIAADTRGPGLIAARFHNALANWILEVAREAKCADVVLSGGCFQNACLTYRAATLLAAAGFRVHTHHQVPPNDGGIALGQAVLAGK